MCRPSNRDAQISQELTFPRKLLYCQSRKDGVLHKIQISTGPNAYSQIDVMLVIPSDASPNQRHCDIVLSDRNKEIRILCGSI
jgi:hypothetical protein